jgi:hypothetical protein
LAKKIQYLCSCKSAMLLPILYDYQVSCAATNIMIIKSAMLLPIFLECQGSKLWNIGEYV